MSYRDFQQGKACYAASPDWKGAIFCPKPRRVGVLTESSVRPIRSTTSQEAESLRSKEGAKLLEMILGKEGFGAESLGTQSPSSSPYFSGSPPCRTTNPVIQDTQFGNKVSLTSLTSPLPPSNSSPTSSPRQGGSTRKKHGRQSPIVRVEGFDCLKRDRQRSSIPGVAY